MLQTVEFEALPQRQISDDVYVVLREKIVAGQLIPGQRLAVDHIAGQLGASRTPVKDALSRLGVEGLIEIHARLGTFVTRISPDDVRDCFEVRQALEAKACDLLDGKSEADRTHEAKDLLVHHIRSSMRCMISDVTAAVNQS